MTLTNSHDFYERWGVPERHFLKQITRWCHSRPGGTSRNIGSNEADSPTSNPTTARDDCRVRRRRDNVSEINKYTQKTTIILGIDENNGMMLKYRLKLEGAQVGYTVGGYFARNPTQCRYVYVTVHGICKTRFRLWICCMDWLPLRYRH